MARDFLRVVAVLVDDRWVPQLRCGSNIVRSFPEVSGTQPHGVCQVVKELWPEVLLRLRDPYPKPLLYYRCGWDLRLIVMHQEAWLRRYQVMVDYREVT
ncbi:hypothetical protein LMC02_09730 [Limosilactobacillus reuteri]|uniref:hypothetical protein n=1 Tax=Limosilactobacillus reuteri TaxID=1598 RepID=UPI001E535655|nr:hypothetical protein [Limosilactobacillus reuteri]MCC4500266.1 hypothetical protein [Limosilactobacillus reuteri]MCC4500591.1 hypothetical protein [Limosilactobacillus reuteri]